MILLSLQDPRVTLRTGLGELAASPGFANTAGSEPVFGDAAQQIARLHPRHNFHQFWQQLSLDPLVVKTKQFRHHADMAYRHLQLLSQDLKTGESVAVAAPSSFSRNQLSVLLGILKPLPFQTSVLVDHGLLLAGATGAADSIIIDLQLHQAVFSCYRLINGVLQRDRISQVPGAGLLALHDAWNSVVANAFLQQTRFDPTHSAETEQYIANQLPVWLQAAARNGEVLLEINHKGTVHQARVTHEAFCERTKSIYGRLQRELAPLQSDTSEIYIPSEHLTLPGLQTGLPGVNGLPADAAQQTLALHGGSLARAGEALTFATRVSISTTPSVAVNAPMQQPTHVLVDHSALALPMGRTVLGELATPQEPARQVAVPAWSSGGAVLLRGPRGIQLESSHGPLLLNGQKAEQSSSWLQLGDQLQIGATAVQLIHVE